MFREMNKPSRAGMAELYDVLHAEKLLNVRYTQSTEELNLFKLAAYVKQYLAHKQRRPRLITEDGRTVSSPSGAEEGDSEASRGEVGDTSARLSGGASPAGPHPVSEPSAGATPTESDLIPYDEREQAPINFSSHFKKSTLGQKVIRTLVHPLYTKEKKFEFLNRHVPVDTKHTPTPMDDVDMMLPMSDREPERERKERETSKRIAYE